MNTHIDGVGIKAISVAVPSNVVDVLQYVKCRDEENIKRVIKKTGISSIRITKPGQTTSDLCFEAASQLFRKDFNKDNICAILFISKTPDYVVTPPTSCLLQARLGLQEEVLCYDSMAACYGFVAGLELAGLIAKQYDADVLLMTGDTNSKMVSHKDITAVMLGDGGGGG